VGNLSPECRRLRRFHAGFKETGLLACLTTPLTKQVQKHGKTEGRNGWAQNLIVAKSGRALLQTLQ